MTQSYYAAGAVTASPSFANGSDRPAPEASGRAASSGAGQFLEREGGNRMRWRGSHVTVPGGPSIPSMARANRES